MPTKKTFWGSAKDQEQKQLNVLCTSSDSYTLVVAACCQVKRGLWEVIPDVDVNLAHADDVLQEVESTVLGCEVEQAVAAVTFKMEKNRIILDFPCI